MVTRSVRKQNAFRQRAIHEVAVKVLPQYEADGGPLTAAQLRQIRERVRPGEKRSVTSAVLGTEAT
jgi:hypothetical protein